MKGNVWESVKKWFYEQKCYHIFPLLIYMTLYLFWFHLVEIIPRSWYFSITMPFDYLIPFCEYFVIFYLSWFGFVAAGLVFMFFYDRDSFDQLQTMLMIGMTLFLVLSTILPNRQPLRLLEMPRDNIFTRMIIVLWRTDTPTNVWPSIHVYNSAVIAIAFFKSKKKKLQTLPVRLLIGIWSAGIIASTAFVKQHSLFDIISALALTVIVYIVVYTYGKVYHCKKWDAMWEAKTKGA